MRIRISMLVMTLCLLAKMSIFGRTPDKEISNYVVIGAFAVQDHAAKFVAEAKKLKFNAIAEINPKRNLFYVYVLNTEDRKAAFREANKLRKDTPYFDTWVYTGMLGVESGTGLDVHPVTQNKIDNVEAKDVPPAGQPAFAPVQEPPPKDGTTVASSVDPEVNEKVETDFLVVDKTKPVDVEEGSRNFLFTIFSADEKKPLDGDIDLIDLDRTRKMASYKGNQNVILRPVNKSGNMRLICEVFGYRKLEKDINFDKPQAGPGVVLAENQVQVTFEMVHLKKGDIAVMYNVYFFKDAAIMRPESRSEVQTLLSMMKENQGYKIRIHGHTNGKSAGKIISMGEEKNFFALNDTHETFGTAKQLSEERANIIREYLTKEGVEPTRMEVKAWGGKKPIHDKFSPKAQENVRVEIEILDDK